MKILLGPQHKENLQLTGKLQLTCPCKWWTNSVAASITNTHAITTDKQMTTKTRNCSRTGIFLFSSCCWALLFGCCCFGGFFNQDDEKWSPTTGGLTDALDCIQGTTEILKMESQKFFYNWQLCFLNSFLPSGHFRTVCCAVYNFGKSITQPNPKLSYLLCASCPRRSLKNSQPQKDISWLVTVTFTDAEPLENQSETANW